MHQMHQCDAELNVLIGLARRIKAGAGDGR
jgi:hypothetical protein